MIVRLKERKAQSHSQGTIVLLTAYLNDSKHRILLYRLDNKQSVCCLIVNLVIRYQHWPHIEDNYIQLKPELGGLIARIQKQMSF